MTLQSIRYKTEEPDLCIATDSDRRTPGIDTAGDKPLDLIQFTNTVGEAPEPVNKHRPREELAIVRVPGHGKVGTAAKVVLFDTARLVIQEEPGEFRFFGYRTEATLWSIRPVMQANGVQTVESSSTTKPLFCIHFLKSLPSRSRNPS